MSLTRLFAIAAIVAAAACGNSTGYGGNPPPPPPPPGPPPPPPPPPGPTLDVTVGPGQSFSPSSGSVTSGGTVTWTWAANNTLTHNVTFNNGTAASNDQSSGTFSHTFPTVTTSTTFSYHCTFHSGMTGSITVVP